MIDLLTLLTTVEIFPEDAMFTSRMVGKNKDFEMRQQRGYYKKPSSRFPIEFKFSLPRDQPAAYPAGIYFLHPDSFQTDNYDGLELSTFDFKLMPVPEELKKPVGAVNGK